MKFPPDLNVAKTDVGEEPGRHGELRLIFDGRLIQHTWPPEVRRLRGGFPVAPARGLRRSSRLRLHGESALLRGLAERAFFGGATVCALFRGFTVWAFFRFASERAFFRFASERTFFSGKYLDLARLARVEGADVVQGVRPWRVERNLVGLTVGSNLIVKPAFRVCGAGCRPVSHRVAVVPEGAVVHIYRQRTWVEHRQFTRLDLNLE